MLCGAEVTGCSEINKKQIKIVWAECRFLSSKPLGARNQ